MDRRGFLLRSLGQSGTSDGGPPLGGLLSNHQEFVSGSGGGRLPQILWYPGEPFDRQGRPWFCGVESLASGQALLVEADDKGFSLGSVFPTGEVWRWRVEPRSSVTLPHGVTVYAAEKRDGGLYGSSPGLPMGIDSGAATSRTSSRIFAQNTPWNTVFVSGPLGGLEWDQASDDGILRVPLPMGAAGFSLVPGRRIELLFWYPCRTGWCLLRWVSHTTMDGRFPQKMRRWADQGELLVAHPLRGIWESLGGEWSGVVHLSDQHLWSVSDETTPQVFSSGGENLWLLAYSGPAGHQLWSFAVDWGQFHLGALLSDRAQAQLGDVRDWYFDVKGQQIWALSSSGVYAISGSGSEGGVLGFQPVLVLSTGEFQGATTGGSPGEEIRCVRLFHVFPWQGHRVFWILGSQGALYSFREI